MAPSTMERLQAAADEREAEAREALVRTKLISQMDAEEVSLRRAQLDAEDLTASGESRRAARQNLDRREAELADAHDLAVEQATARITDLGPRMRAAQLRVIAAADEYAVAIAEARGLRADYKVAASLAMKLNIDLDVIPAGSYPSELNHRLLTSGGGGW